MKLFLKFLKLLMIVAGFFGIAFIVLSFTDLPYYAYHKLGTPQSTILNKPNTIIMLSGNSIPSPDGLIRIYYTAIAAKKYPEAKIIVAIPENKNDTTAKNILLKELTLRGIDSARIDFEPDGYNTHSQAVNVAKKIDIKLETALLLVSSPEHMYRSVKVFRKIGFEQVGGCPSFEKTLDENLIQDNDTTDNLRVKNINIRYNAWSYMQYELIVLREYCAIIYYKLKGWI